MELGDYDYVVYLSEARKWGGDESPELSSLDKEKVKTNIEKELLNDGLKTEWG